MSITNYFTKLKYLHDEYMESIDIPVCTCGSAQAFTQLIQDQHLMHFLMGLNEPYNTTRGNLLMKTPLRSVNQAYHALLDEERQREITSTSVPDAESSAMAAFNRKFQQGYNNRNYNDVQAQKGRQNTYVNYRGNTVKKNNYYCEHCKCRGHSTERCYKLNVYPMNHKYNNNNNGKGKKLAAHCYNDSNNNDDPVCNSNDGRNNVGNSHNHSKAMINQDQYNHLLELINKQTLNSSNLNGGDNTSSAMLAGKTLCFMSSTMQPLWILDSGATDHITPYLTSFRSYKETVGPDNFITTTNGYRAKVKHIGSVKLTPNIILHDVLHVPELHFNLISINKLFSSLGCQILFSPSSCFIQVPSRSKPMLLGKHKNGLYHVEPTLMKDNEGTSNKITITDNLASYLPNDKKVST